MVNYDALLQGLAIKKLPTEAEVCQICAKAKEVLAEESNVVLVDAPVNVVGNIHGQLDDLLNIFSLCGSCPKANYLFLGGYVNRGYSSIEVFLYLLCLKIMHPDRIVLLRGNHESKDITKVYGFYDECCKRFGNLNTWHDCTDVFEFLPLAANIESAVFAVHGGLSPELANISELQRVDRKVDLGTEGLLVDLLWSDPTETKESGWKSNPRGCGYVFTREITEDFLAINGLKKVYRAHQLVAEGYKQIYGNILTTVWSAPDFLRKIGNSGAVLQVGEDLQEEFTVFTASPIQPTDSSDPIFSILFKK